MRKVHLLLIGLLALSSILVAAVPQAQACNLYCIKGYHCCGARCIPNSQSCTATPSSARSESRRAPRNQDRPMGGATSSGRVTG
jgi:hypothetical protein